jgi:hypothetical protein
MTEKKAPAGGFANIADERAGEGHKPGWKERLIHEIKRFLVMFLYLWVMFGLFLLYESVVLARHDIPFTRYGFAVINAAVLAKVMLIAEDLNIARGLDGKPLIYSVLYKSVVFSIVFLVFDVAEGVVIGLLRGKSVFESIPTIGGGSLQGVLSVALIMTFALIPYFAFRELSRAIGADELRALFFTRGLKVGIGEAAGKAA